jgi:molybdenum cofactor cytidylyltransferase
VVYGFDGLDKPLDDEICYNLEGVLESVPDLDVGIQVEPPVLRRIFLEAGYMDHGEECETYVVVNQAEGGRDRAAEFARELFHPDVKGIAVASAKEGWLETVDNQGHSVTAVVLAAGESKRFGENKLLKEFDGMPVIRKVLGSVKGAEGIDDIILVTGHQSEKLVDAVGDLGDVQVVHNPEHSSGIAYSLKCGVEASGNTDAILVLLGDMPGVTSELITRVINVYRNSAASAVRPMAGDEPGHPVVIGRELFPQMRQLGGDVGAKVVLDWNKDRVLTFDIGPGTQADIDTIEDYEQIQGGK